MSKLAGDDVLRAFVQGGLDLKWSPEQISNKLVEDFPDQEMMRVSPETIYQSIYVQARGTLKRDLEARVADGSLDPQTAGEGAG